MKELRGEIVSAALADATTATNPRPAAAEHVEALLNKVMGDNPGARSGTTLFTKKHPKGCFFALFIGNANKQALNRWRTSDKKVYMAAKKTGEGFRYNFARKRANAVSGAPRTTIRR